MAPTYSSRSWIGYRQMKQRQQTHAIFVSEIPTEHYVSLLMPTKRLGAAGYAGFASPARRILGKPPLQGAPDRWWVYNAQNGRLFLYGLTQFSPFSAQALESELEIVRPAISMKEMQQLGQDIDHKLDQLAPIFFNGEEGSAEDRHLTLQALQFYIPAPLFPQYQALAPDFMAWLAGQ